MSRKVEVRKARLPHKIWSDCIECRKFPDCDETAVVLSVGSQEGSRREGESPEHKSAGGEGRLS